MRKHFRIKVSENGMSWSRDSDKIAAEAALDGIYIIRTNFDSETAGASEAVEVFTSLSQVECAFRFMKTTRLGMWPAHVYNADRVGDVPIGVEFDTGGVASAPSISSGIF